MALGANKANSLWKLRRSRVGPGFQAVVPPVMSAEERKLAQEKYVEDRPHIFGGKNKDEMKVDYSKVEKPVSTEEIEREFMAKAAPPEFDFKAFVKQCRQTEEQKREGPPIGSAWRRSTRNKKVVDYRDPEDDDDVEMEEKSHAPPSKSKRGNKPRLILTRKRKRPRDDDDNDRRSSSPQKRKAMSTNGDATNDDHPRKKRRRGRPRKDEIDSFSQNAQAEVIDLCDDDDESTVQGNASSYTSRRAPSNIVAPPAPVNPSLSRGLDLLSTPADRAAYSWNVLAHQGAWQAYTSLLANFNQRDNKALSAFFGNRFGRNLSPLNHASFLSSGMPALTSQILAGKTGLTSTPSTTNMTANNPVGKNRQKSSAPSSLKVNQYGYVYSENQRSVPPAIPPPRPSASSTVSTTTKTAGIDSSAFSSNRGGISCVSYTGEPRQDVPNSAKSAPKQSESSDADAPTNNSANSNSPDGQLDVIRLD